MAQFTKTFTRQGRICLAILFTAVGLLSTVFLIRPSLVAHADGLTIANPSFETPALGTGNYQYRPSGASWTFVLGAGIEANGSAWLIGGGSNAPDGTQAAFLQGDGSVSQAISGFQANTSYYFIFSAAQRANNQGGQSIHITLDSTDLGTFTPASTAYAKLTTRAAIPGAGTHTLTFTGTAASCDCSAFIDNIRVGVSIANPSFEVPSLGTGNYQYQPSGASWSFGANTGIEANGSAWLIGGGSNAPDGVQAAFLQGSNGGISQALSGFQANTSYQFTFSAAQRANNQGGQSIHITLDSTDLGTFTPASTAYADLTTNTVTPTAGTHTLSFSGTANCDCSAFIDNIRVTETVKPLLGAFFFDGQFIEQAQYTGQEVRGSWFTDYDYQQPFFGWYDASDTASTGHTIPNHAKIVDEEIDAAHNAGLDYFAFDWYGDTTNLGVDGALHDYLASSKNGEIKYALNLVSSTQFEVNPNKNQWEQHSVPTLVQRFQDAQYVKLPGNRPLVFLIGAGSWESIFGSSGLAEIQYLRTQAQAAGLGDPYIVEVTNDAGGAAALQLNALSDYGPSNHSGFGHETYAARAANDDSDNSGTSITHVYAITAGADGRAVECFGENAGWADLPTYSQFEQHLSAVYTTLQGSPSNATNPPLAVIYAWGEVQEGGGGLLPSVQQGNMFLDAVHAVTSGNYPSVYYDTVNDSYLNNGSNTGIGYGSGWSYNGPPSSSCNTGTNHTTDANGDQLWGFYGNDETTTTTSGASASLTYDNSTGFRLIGATGPNRGQIDIKVDGQDKGIKNLSSPTLLRQQILFDDEGALSSGTHTIQIITQNSNLVGIDAIWVQRQRTGTAVSNPVPPQTVVAQGYESRAEVSWDVVPGATSYQVWRSTTNDGPYTQVATVSAPSNANARVTYADGGLTNGSTYYYVVKAVAGSATSDNSDQTSAIPTPNLALGGTYSSSSNYSASETPDKAFDNNLATDWQAAAAATPSSPQSLEADFAGGATQSFNRVKLWEYGNRTAAFHIDYWNGSAWTTAYTGTTIGDYNSPREITFQEVQGSKIRIVFTSTTSTQIIYEFEVYLR